MNYYVKLFDFEKIHSEQALFKSAREDDCWASVRKHLTCGVPSVREKAKRYVVMDSLGRCYDPSYDVYILKKAA